MSNGKAKAAIDVLLEGKSDAFKATVLELSRQLNWDEDDPAFLVAIATGQLQALLQQYPDKITAAMERAASTLEADWQQLQAKLAVSAMKSAETARQIDGRLREVRTLLDGEHSQVEQLLQTERVEVQQLMAAERAAMAQQFADERGAMAQQAQESAEQQKQVLETHTKNLIAQGVITAKERADQQVKEIVGAVRGKHYWEAVAFACFAAGLLVSLAWTGGWVSRGRTENSSVWGDIERWNQDELQACFDVNRTTCNFHIKPPK